MKLRLKTNWKSTTLLALNVFALSLGMSFNLVAMEVDVSNAPASALSLTVNAIQSAHQTILLNIYELSSPEITQALLNRIESGIQVKILEEGQPVGGLSAPSKSIQSELVQAMARMGSQDQLFEMRGAKPVVRRFKFDHAKYAVIDGESVLVGSENYSPTGNPDPGKLGNRGWEVWIHDSTLAGQFAGIFSSDADPSNQDIVNLTATSNFSLSTRKPTAAPTASSDTLGGPEASPIAFEADSVKAIFSPTTSQAGLVGLINQASKTLGIEQMTFDADWGTAGASSPLIDAVVAAAGKGVQVRVLLNDDSVFATPGKAFVSKNKATVDLLNQTKGITAKIANVKAMGVDYIHNKGVIVDGDTTLVSSMNWDYNSITHNRESAVIISGSDVGGYYLNLFNGDWTASGGTN